MDRCTDFDVTIQLRASKILFIVFAICCTTFLLLIDSFSLVHLKNKSMSMIRHKQSDNKNNQPLTAHQVSQQRNRNNLDNLHEKCALYRARESVGLQDRELEATTLREIGRACAGRDLRVERRDEQKTSDVFVRGR